MVERSIRGPVQPKTFPPGTSMLFQQTTAPAGWTKQTDHNNKGIRLQTGTVTTGGTDNFTTTFSSSKVTDSHTLTSGESAAHTHAITNAFASGTGSTRPGVNDTTSIAGWSTDSSGSGGGHTHTVTLDLEFVDVIIANKD